MGKVLDFSSCFKGELFALTFCILTMIYQNVYFLIFILLVFSELSESMSSFSSWPLLFQIFPLLHSLFFLSFWYSNCVCLTFWNGPTVIECSYFFLFYYSFFLSISVWEVSIVISWSSQIHSSFMSTLLMSPLKLFFTNTDFF